VEWRRFESKCAELYVHSSQTGGLLTFDTVSSYCLRPCGLDSSNHMSNRKKRHPPRESGNANTQHLIANSPDRSSALPVPEKQKKLSSNLGNEFMRVAKVLGVPSTVVGILSLLSSFFPHLTISDPTTMDPRYFFSKYVVLKNEGWLPVFRVRCGLAVGHVARIKGPTVDSYGTGADPQFEPPECNVGTLSPGDAHTIPTNIVFQPDPPTDDVRDADFSILVSYVPVLPPIRMDRCVHFTTYVDSAGNRYWFRTPLAPGRCPMFRWQHESDPE
jgi:hypothetical protein